ncbi:hypothetical protein [Bradyrhizobium jicamae]|uniref:hypothetical protein n=1 Tax=Bradyrhizobium jicamae TaxID=280332 RepID=UPI00201274E0|nr:hypothetical protein [Bradyrhizobium jicamae]
MPKPESLPIEKISVPVKRKMEIKPQVVEEIAGSILEIGQQTHIRDRPSNQSHHFFRDRFDPAKSIRPEGAVDDKADDARASH